MRPLGAGGRGRGAGAARPHAGRYGGITRQLTDRVRRDLQQSYSAPGSATR